MSHTDLTDTDTLIHDSVEYVQRELVDGPRRLSERHIHFLAAFSVGTVLAFHHGHARLRPTPSPADQLHLVFVRAEVRARLRRHYGA